MLGCSILVRQRDAHTASRLGVVVDGSGNGGGSIRGRHVQRIPVFLVEQVVYARLYAQALDDGRLPPRREIDHAVPGRLEVGLGRIRRLIRIFDIVARRRGAKRSEEHTSELQSLMRISYSVFCLKKK